MKEKAIVKIKEVVVNKENQIPLVDEVSLIAHERETGYKAVVDKSNMETICVIPNVHQIVQHTHVLKEVEKLDNYIIKNKMLLKNGSQLMIEITEREPKKVALLPNDFLECGARVFNDYSKNCGLSVQGYGLRLACENGMVAPVRTQKMQIFAYGTNEFSKELEIQISNCIKVWETDVAEIMEKANSVTISVKDVTTRLPKLSKKYMDLVLDKLEDQDTVYNIWNAYTSVITHEIAPKVKVQAVIKLQKRANKVLALVKPFE